MHGAVGMVGCICGQYNGFLDCMLRLLQYCLGE